MSVATTTTNEQRTVHVYTGGKSTWSYHEHERMRTLHNAARRQRQAAVWCSENPLPQ